MTDRFNVIDIIAKHDKFSTFTRLVTASGMKNILAGPGQFTVFVPTNDAFSKMPEAKINELVDEPGQTRLKSLLAYHILPGKVMAAGLGSAPSRKAFSGEELMFTDINGLKVNGASIQARNLDAANGVVHALDSVLTPTMVPRTPMPWIGPVVTPTIDSRVLTAVPKTTTALPVIATQADAPVLSAVPATNSAVTAKTVRKSA